MKDDDQPLLLDSSPHTSLSTNRRLAVGRKNQLFIGLCLLGCLFVLIIVNERYGNSICCYFDVKPTIVHSAVRSGLFDFSNENGTVKHFYTDIDGWCEGLANMLFRIASLYGIGKQIHRIPCLQGSCAENYQGELYAAFPRLSAFPLKRKCWNEEAYSVPFANTDPRIYDNITKLKVLDDKPNLRLRSSYLQEVKFFENYRKEIREIFNFDETMNIRVDKYASTLFNKTNSIASKSNKKVCVHMRGRDFITNKYLSLLPSLLEFTLPAMQYLTNLAANETNGTISIVLFSDDSKFLKVVVEKFKTFDNNSQIFVPNTLKRLEYMNLASRYCDYYLMTASGSTYGWWTAYLIDDSKQHNVFYNARIFRPKKQNSAKHFVENNFFPTEWRRLVLETNSSAVYEQNRNEIPLVPI